MKFLPTTLCIVAASVSTSAFAQDNQHVDILAGWPDDTLYTAGISVDQLLYNAAVYGPTGDEIGSVENVIFSDSGEALAIIAEIGGFWDIGDTHMSIPWDQVEINAAESRVTIPITEETVGDYSLYGGDGGWFSEEDYFALDTEFAQAVDDDIDPGPTVFRASEFMGDYVYLTNATPYGYVNDLIVEDDQITAVVVDAGAYYGTPGYYAYPYNYAPGTTWNPYDRRYNLPYGTDTVDQIENFDYDRLTNTIQ